MHLAPVRRANSCSPPGRLRVARGRVGGCARHLETKHTNRRFVVDGTSGKLVPFGQQAMAFTCFDTHCTLKNHHIRLPKLEYAKLNPRFYHTQVLRRRAQRGPAGARANRGAERATRPRADAARLHPARRPPHGTHRRARGHVSDKIWPMYRHNKSDILLWWDRVILW